MPRRKYNRHLLEDSTSIYTPTIQFAFAYTNAEHNMRAAAPNLNQNQTRQNQHHSNFQAELQFDNSESFQLTVQVMDVIISHASTNKKTNLAGTYTILV